MITCLVLTHNRLNFLKDCIESIRRFTHTNYEIIVINNHSDDGTYEWLNQQKDIKSIHLEKNIGVIARNKGIEIAKGEYIAQIDDDVVVSLGWDRTILSYFIEGVGAVGVQGGTIGPWKGLNVFKHNNTYVDFLTGFFWVYKNCGLKYDESFGKFWHEELDLSLQFKAAGHRLRIAKEHVCTHNCQRREEVDWTLHNKNLEYVWDKWALMKTKLGLEGDK